MHSLFFLSLEMPQLFSYALRLRPHHREKNRFSSDHRSQALSGEVSTSLGDHLGTPRVVGFFVSFSFALIDFVLVSILLFYSKGRLVF